jgi:hypothetical protein
VDTQAVVDNNLRQVLVGKVAGALIMGVRAPMDHPVVLQVLLFLPQLEVEVMEVLVQIIHSTMQITELVVFMVVVVVVHIVKILIINLEVMEVMDTFV